MNRSGPDFQNLYHTVSRAKTIYHAIAGSGAKISVNFMDVGLFFHIVFPL